MPKETVNVKIVTPKGVSYEEAASFVQAPGQTGQVGVIANHSPTLALLKCGELEIHSDNKEDCFFIPDGTINVGIDHVTILTSYTEKVSEIDPKRANNAKERAEKRLHKPDSDTNTSRANASLVRADTRLSLYKKHHEQH